MTITVVCGQCGSEFERRPIDLVRSNGRPMFCSLKCFGLSKVGTGKVWPEVKKICQLCQSEFIVTHNLKTIFCSRSCASKGSMSEERREAQRVGGYRNPFNSKTIAKGLKTREAWKYEKLEKILKDRDHEFEFELNGFIFDLILKDTNTIIEFDSNYHFSCVPQTELDHRKQKSAESAGYIVIRLTTERNQVIPASLIQGL